MNTRPFASVLPSPRPRIVSVGTALPRWRYPQEAIADLLDVPDGIGRRFFRCPNILTRHLYLEPTEDGEMPKETQADLLQRHRRGSLELGREAITRCLTPAGVDPAEVDYLCCVSSTGLMLPGLSAMYLRHAGFRQDCQRADVVGMGCNAALNGLNAAAGWTVANPGRYALVVCCEINSAIHVRDGRVVTSLVNSLFGDGCGAVLLQAGGRATGPELWGFSSHVVPDAWKAISYHWSADHNKFELYLDRAIPDVLGEHSPTPITALLDTFSLCRCKVSHWLVHAGGKKVLDAIAQANKLTPHDLRHATSVLKSAGNLGSPTVLATYERLLEEDTVTPGDFGVMVTMGPGATIETALLRW
jgi:3,5-dihydroxyphenylacetyl-CoA synthase